MLNRMIAFAMVSGSRSGAWSSGVSGLEDQSSPANPETEEISTNESLENVFVPPSTAGFLVPSMSFNRNKRAPVATHDDPEDNLLEYRESRQEEDNEVCLIKSHLRCVKVGLQHFILLFDCRVAATCPANLTCPL